MVGMVYFGVRRLAAEITGASSLTPYLFRDDPMYALADEDDIHDLQITQIRFSRDVLLEPRSQRFAQAESDEGKGQGEGDEQNPPERGLGRSKRCPGKGRGEKRSGRHVGSAAGVDRQSAFAGVQACVCFSDGFPDLLGGQVAEQEEAGRVGMPSHAFARVFAREQMDGGMFERVVAPRFEDEGKIEDHGMIINEVQDVVLIAPEITTH
jgi:hypothetical protein